MNSKDEAIQRVKKNNLTEYSQLYTFAVEWVKIQMKPFTSEDLRKSFVTLKQPNVMGAVINALAKENLIFKHSVGSAKRSIAHGRLLNTWISREYSLKQSNNRKNKPNQVNLFEV